MGGGATIIVFFYINFFFLFVILDFTLVPWLFKEYIKYLLGS